MLLKMAAFSATKTLIIITECLPPPNGLACQFAPREQFPCLSQIGRTLSPQRMLIRLRLWWMAHSSTAEVSQFCLNINLFTHAFRDGNIRGPFDLKWWQYWTRHKRVPIQSKNHLSINEQLFEYGAFNLPLPLEHRWSFQRIVQSPWLLHARYEWTGNYRANNLPQGRDIIFRV